MSPPPGQSVILFELAGVVLPTTLGLFAAWGVARGPRLCRAWRILCLASVFAVCVAGLAGAMVWMIA